MSTEPKDTQHPWKAPQSARLKLAERIVEALLLDEKDGGYDLEAGMFGRHLSALVDHWAWLEEKQRQITASQVLSADFSGLDSRVLAHPADKPDVYQQIAASLKEPK